MNKLMQMLCKGLLFIYNLFISLIISAICRNMQEFCASLHVLEKINKKKDTQNKDRKAILFD